MSEVFGSSDNTSEVVSVSEPRDVGIPGYKILFTWGVAGDGCGAAGVTDAPTTAMQRLTAAMEAMPHGPVKGIIQCAQVNMTARRPSYVHGCVVVRARRDEDTSGIVFERGGE
ncbi:hypothetical protein [Nonomuraea glycinis]|uniref:hypothetical protein n=1 Tax=Nonomuraea glycinis TaxID=2047744 RepID=UPI002E0E0CAC|nr:hypothetical protein OHA68_29505 [Nonomuraea glycinis]